MSIFERIAIGTANWGKEYNGVKVPERDIEKILGYCQCNGIDTLDCATAYGWDWTRANSYFNKIVKIQSIDEIEKVIETEPYCVMAHNEDDWELAEQIYQKVVTEGIRPGISLYEPLLSKGCLWLNSLFVIECPYSMYDRRFVNLMRERAMTFYVRSIFLRGRIIQDGIPAEEAIKFVLANPYIDKIIIGADSYVQLRRNLDFIVRWKNLEKHDVNLLDPRKWE